MWNDEIALAKSETLSDFAAYIERVYGENGVCSANMCQRTIDTILDIAREHASDMEDVATSVDDVDARVLETANIYGDYGDATSDDESVDA